jgi:cbb3-type cytochrome oxidase maturation protein
MSVVVLLIVFSILVALIFLAAFIWAVRSGQFDDMESPSVRILFEDKNKSSSASKKNKPKK